MTNKDILDLIPHRWPFRFVDEILDVNADRASGYCYFDPELPAYEGHFPNEAITPGVLLTEAMAQTTVLPMGIYILNEDKQDLDTLKFVMSSNQVDYFLPVWPGSRLLIEAEKMYYRFGKLKCKVEMLNDDRQLVCRGEIAGMLVTKSDR